MICDTVDNRQIFFLSFAYLELKIAVGCHTVGVHDTFRRTERGPIWHNHPSASQKDHSPFLVSIV